MKDWSDEIRELKPKPNAEELVVYLNRYRITPTNNKSWSIRIPGKEFEVRLDKNTGPEFVEFIKERRRNSKENRKKGLIGLVLITIIVLSFPLLIKHHGINLLRIDFANLSSIISIVGILTTILLAIMIYISSLMARGERRSPPKHLMGFMHSINFSALAIGIIVLLSLICLYATGTETGSIFEIVIPSYYSYLLIFFYVVVFLGAEKFSSLFLNLHIYSMDLSTKTIHIYITLLFIYNIVIISWPW